MAEEGTVEGSPASVEEALAQAAALAASEKASAQVILKRPFLSTCTTGTLPFREMQLECTSQLQLFFCCTPPLVDL